MRAGLESARRGGIEACGADLFADADALRTAPVERVEQYPEGLADALVRMHPDAWMYTGALENYPQLVERMAGQLPFLGNGSEVLARVRSPEGLEEVLRGTEVLYPTWASDQARVPTDGTWLVKPVRSAGGARIAPFTGQVLSDETAWYFQQRVAGVPAAALFVAAGGRARLLGVTRQWVGEDWTGAQGFAYCGSAGPMEVAPEVAGQLETLGSALAQSGVQGVFGVDVVLQDKRVWVIEVNPRYTASMEVLEWALGFSAVGLHVAACREGRLGEMVNEASCRVAKAIVFARRRVTVSKEFSARAMSCPLPEGEGGGGTRAWLADIPVAGTVVEPGYPVLTVLARGENAGEVEAQLRHRVAELQAELDC